MKLEALQLLFEYTDWSNKRILATCERIDPAQFVAPVTPDPGHGSLRGTLIHTLDTEYGWRMLCQHSQYTPDLTETELPTLDLLAQRWAEEEADRRAYLASLNDSALTGLIRYTNNGQPRERVLWHCLYHIVNHSGQHRSEAAAMLTGYGASPGEFDFTIFVRERQ